MLQPALYLLPSTMSDAPVDSVLPRTNIEMVREIKHYVVENVRTARRFLKRCDRESTLTQSHSPHLTNIHVLKMSRQCLTQYLRDIL